MITPLPKPQKPAKATKKPLKRTKLRKTSARPLSKLKREAWRVFSLWIRERDKYVCVTCGKSGKGSFMHAGHFISRKHNATMFDERNVSAQCMNCNLWGYGNMGVYALKIQEKYGAEIIKELTEKSQTIHKFTERELEDIIKKYTL